MAQLACQYDCSQVRLELPPYPDISGIGVTLGYTITAGLAVFIVIVSYIVAYDPKIDPFGGLASQQVTNTNGSFRPNPIDVRFIDIIRKPKSNLWATARQTQMGMIPCMLIMSDLQLLAGLSILISGYTQLRCGLTAYHWQRLVYLAWFASITHLSTLTFLRSYLHRNPRKRWWRIIAMSVLVAMLVTGLMPTGHYVFPDMSDRSLPRDAFDTDPEFRPLASDPAICHWTSPSIASFNTSSPYSKVARRYIRYLRDTVRVQRRYTIVSSIMLFFGMVFRMINLHRATTNGVLIVRRSFSRCSLLLLHKLYSYCKARSRYPSLATCLVYRPFLSLYLVVGSFVDYWCSMAFEVHWLLASFIWGILRLWIISISSNISQEPGSQDWSFGQVLPLVMLFAPLIAILENWKSGPTEAMPHENNANDPQPDMTEDGTSSTIATSRIPDVLASASDVESPDLDFSQISWMQGYYIFFMIAVGALSGSIIFRITLGYDVTTILSPSGSAWSSPLLNLFLGLFSTILFCLFIESWSHRGDARRRKILKYARYFTYCSVFALYIIPATMATTSILMTRVSMAALWTAGRQEFEVRMLRVKV